MAQTTGDANFKNAIQIYYDRVLLTRLEKRLKLDQWGAKKKLPKNEGNQVKWTRYDNLAPDVNPLTEGVTPAVTNLTSQQITATPVQFGNFVELSDLLVDEALDPVVENALKVLAYMAAQSFDTIIRNSLHSNVTDQFANGKADENAILQTDVLNAEEIRKAATNLKIEDVMPFSDGNFQACIHPASGFDIQSDTASTGWIELNKYVSTDQAMKGELGKLYGVRFGESSNIEKVTNTQPVDVYRNFMFGMEAYGLVEIGGQNLRTFRKNRGSSGTADPLDQRSTVGYKFSNATPILDPVRAIEMYAASAFDA